MTDEKILASKRRRVEEAEAGNQRSYTELQQAIAEAGGRWGGMDTSDMRRELFIQQLVEWGIITEDQVLDFELEFHKRVEDSLNQQWESFRQQLAEAKARKLSVVKKPDVLLGPDGQPMR